MGFTPKSWGNFSSGGTPLNAAALVDLETRLSNYTDSAGGSGLGIFNVKSYGAVGNGIANDTTPIANAAADAALVGGIVFFPPGTYLANFNVPNGISVWGSGPNTSIINGALTSIGSRTQYRDIKIGVLGTRFYFSTSPSDVLFENCTLFGGTNEGIIYMNDDSFSNIRFEGCEITGNTQGGNGVAIIDRGTFAKHIENITFTRCWFHGNDRMNVECIIRQDGIIPITTGYRNVSLYDCILDKAVTGTANEINISYDGGPLTDLSGRSSGYSTVRGCKITGGIDCLELAGPTDMLIEGNDLSSPSSGDILSMSQYGTAATEHHIARIVGNKFLGTGNVVVQGEGVSFTGNDMKTSGFLRMAGASYSSVIGNILEATGTAVISLEDSHHNTIVGNQVRGGTNTSIQFLYSGTTRNLIDDNYIVALNAPFTDSSGNEQDFGKNIYTLAGVAYDFERGQQNWAIPYSASMTPDSASQYQIITVTNATPMTINGPPGGSALTFEIYNNTALPIGAITWDAIYKLAGAFTNPAAGKRRTISFYWNGSAMVETNRAAADI